MRESEREETEEEEDVWCVSGEVAVVGGVGTFQFLMPCSVVDTHREGDEEGEGEEGGTNSNCCKKNNKEIRELTATNR